MKPLRSSLTVPGSSLRFLEKAKGAAVDQVILDLEDSVTLAEKDQARANIVEVLKAGGFTPPVSVRINSLQSEIGQKDLEVAKSISRTDSFALIIPKVESPESLDELCRELLKIEKEIGRQPYSITLQVQIESARGLVKIFEIAGSCKRIQALIFGPGDFAANLGMRVANIGERPQDLDGLDPYYFPLMMILTAAKANDLYAIDGPFSDLKDEVGMAKSCLRSATLGFDGKWAIHPSQIPIIESLFSPSQEEFDRAIRITDALESSGDAGAIVVDGHMIDEATRKLAQATIARGIAAGMKRKKDTQ
jgi:citrate lyase subunit beta/citryl-CoA lyase